MTNDLLALADAAHESARISMEGVVLRMVRRKYGWKGCQFCFGTCYGELRDGSVVPCPECNGLCI